MSASVHVSVWSMCGHVCACTHMCENVQLLCMFMFVFCECMHVCENLCLCVATYVNEHVSTCALHMTI